MHPEAVAAGLLGAQHRAGLDHLRPDELEADRDLVGLDPVVRAERRGRGRVVDASHDRLAQPAVLGQVVHEQAGDLQLVEERAALVGRARPIRVAVEQQARGRNRRAAIVASASSTCGRIGSGFTPPKYGLRSLWISVTRIRPPASSRGIQPEPAPYSGSTRIETSAAFSASRSSVRRTNRS